MKDTGKGTPFSRWLTDQMSKRDVNYTGMAHLLRVKPNTARAWCIGESEPSGPHLRRIAEIFSVDPKLLFRLVDWLPSEAEEAHANVERLAPGIRQLSDEQVAILEVMIDHFVGCLPAPPPQRLDGVPDPPESVGQ